MAFHFTEQQLAALHPGVHRSRQWLDTPNDAVARFRIDTVVVSCGLEVGGISG